MIVFLDQNTVFSTDNPSLIATRYDQPLFSQLEEVRSKQMWAMRQDIQAYSDYLTKLSTYNTLLISGRAADTVPPVHAPDKPSHTVVVDQPDADGSPVISSAPWPGLPDPVVVHVSPSGGIKAGG